MFVVLLSLILGGLAETQTSSVGVQVGFLRHPNAIWTISLVLRRCYSTADTIITRHLKWLFAVID
jgi:hypothetical protein